MRKFRYLLLLIPYFFSCGNSNKQQGNSDTSKNLIVNQQKLPKLSLPLGMELLSTIDFPEKWTNRPVDDQAEGFLLSNVKSDDYNNLFYFVQKHYNKLYDSLEVNGAMYKSKPVLPFADPVRFDPMISAAALVWEEKNYSVVLYKDSGKYNDQPAGSETGSTINYMYLVTEHDGERLDSLLLYYTERDPIFSRRQYYLVDREKVIHLYRFQAEEDETSLQETKTYHINANGKFVESSQKETMTKKKTNLSAWKGTYTAFIEGEMTTSGTSSTKWTINIENNAVNVSSITFHEPILCNGQYRAVERAGKLELFYDGDEAGCKTSAPNFILKKENGRIYAHGPFGESNVGQWIELLIK
ncbi:hypothetical protein EOD41_04365 [Mucilaginibacter limnophilus]|uniref:Uncharacterized protein n=1 Tax=Mucilaginibacter limnophilus TaxID=1932778 RepID=A0A437MUC8_9SPHI|nr:hypothetical protein [Mucilaginibacter limnophilus]RVU01206.1 hypothetical protein EOD41_04365 [Mucilaginibacter limnophilus]